jgi:hypothetical protein
MESLTVGNSFKYINANSINVPQGTMPGGSGANQTWDFSGLGTGVAGTGNIDTTKIWVMQTSAMTFGVNFPTSTYMKKSILSKFGTLYEFFAESPTGVYMQGFVDSINTSITKYPNNVLTGVKPITFNTTRSDTFTRNYSFGSTPMTSGGTVKFIADAYGTLKLPGKTFSNVLRVKMEMVQNDSGMNGSQQMKIETLRTYYAWYNTANNLPLMQWDSTYMKSTPGSPGQSLTLKYLSGAVDVGVDNTTPIIKDGEAWFTHDQLVMKAAFEAGHAYDVALFNINGQQVYNSYFTSAGGQQAVNLDRIPEPGIYLLCLQDKRYTEAPVVIKVMKR